MSDYLSNLAARTLSVARVARPRLSSRFEPPLAHSGVRGGYSLDSEREEIERDAEDVLSRQTFLPHDLDASTSRPRHDSDSSVLTDATLRRDSEPPFRSSRRHEEREGGRSAARPNQKNPSGKPASFNPTEDTIFNESIQTLDARSERSNDNYISPIRNDAALNAARSGGEESASRERGGERNLQDHDGRSLNIRDARHEAEGSRHSAPTQHNPSAQTPPTSLRHSAPVVPRSITPRAAAPSLARSEQAEAGDSAPRIKVTIGRVEVRAVMPATPPARPARSAPASPSLEDYLKKGERGAR